MRPLVDVGVVTWNTASLTAQALKHLAASDQGCELRVLVHDNASSDGTADAVRAAVPSAQVVCSRRNLGFAAGVNALLARSDAPWFFALNSDAWPEEGAIGALVEAAEARPRAAVAVPKLLRPDDSVEHSTHPFPSMTLAVLDVLGARRRVPRRWAAEHCLEGAWEHDRSRTVDWAVGAAWLMRRSAVDDLGGLDERFFMYLEDMEWCWRARAHGWSVHFEPAAVVRHVGNVSGEQHFGDSRSALEQANLRLLLDEMLGERRARAYRVLQTVALARQYLGARARRHDDMTGHWRGQFHAVRGQVSVPASAAADPDRAETTG